MCWVGCLGKRKGEGRERERIMVGKGRVMVVKREAVMAGKGTQ